MWPKAGIYYYNSSLGALTSCTANGNGGSGIVYENSCQGSVSSCTANSNWFHGIDIAVSCRVDLVGCSVSLNGTTGGGWGYGIRYAFNSAGWPSNCASPSGNNLSGGLRGDNGARVDYTVPMPNANDATGSASSEVY